MRSRLVRLFRRLLVPATAITIAPIMVSASFGAASFSADGEVREIAHKSDPDVWFADNVQQGHSSPVPGKPTRVPQALPIFRIIGAGSSRVQALRLAARLHISPNLRQPDGSLAFVSKQLFNAIPVTSMGAGAPDEDGTPVVLEAFDFEAINDIEPVGKREAQSRTARAFNAAGLPLFGNGRIQHTVFEATDIEGEVVARARLDTQVTYPRTLSGFPVVGTGERAQVTYDPRGRVTHLAYSWHSLRRGPIVTLIDPKAADRRATELFERGCGGQVMLDNLELTRRIVYFAPPLSLSTVTKIVPHYDYGGTAILDGEEIDLTHILLPAIRAGRPRARITATVMGNTVTATTAVSGGTPPYSYAYGSCATTLGTEETFAGRRTSYDMEPRGEGIGDTVSVRVIDANGLVAMASEDIPALPSGGVSRLQELGSQRRAGVVDTGIEWIGDSQGLSQSKADANDFKDVMSDASTIGFFWGESDAYESDFKKPPLGLDPDWVDDVDLQWFQGHGNPNGIAVGSAGDTSGDAFVDYREVLWGDGDLEWVALQACQVLRYKNDDGVPVDQRWIPRFAGLHMLVGYRSNEYMAWDIDPEVFAEWMIYDNATVAAAWILYNEDEERDGVAYRVMGVYGPGGITNVNDHFHGHGSVTKDIRTITGWWTYNGKV